MKLSIIILLTAGLLVSACVGGDQIVAAVNYYCSKPAAERVAYRQLINAKLAGPTIEITCVGDSK